MGLLRVWVRWEKVRRRELALESGKEGYPVTPCEVIWAADT